ncbi:MAG: putative ABC transporter permease [Eubacterium sp.]|nr:putative ABC transporter permease [Eubacterium sp.]
MIFSGLDIGILFFIYGFLGWCLEVVYVAITSRAVQNRGFLHGPICPIYGVGMLGVLMALSPIRENLFLLFLGGMFICSSVELLGGWVLDKLFHMRWWDYSERKFNINGYICLRFSIIWGLGVVGAVNLLHPIVYYLERHLNIVIREILLVVFLIIFTVDMVVTLKKLIGIRQSLGQLDAIAEGLHDIGDQLKDVMGNSAINAADKGAENLKQKEQELQEKQQELMERQREFKENVAQKQHAFRENITQKQHEWVESIERSQHELLARREEVLKNLSNRKSTRFSPLPRLNKNGKSIKIEEYVVSLQKKFENRKESR